MLYLIATPIGNLADISKRALDTLEKSDLILCEDTRRSSILLNHYGIKKPLASYHKFNEQKELKKILTYLLEGKEISLISDAGTPCIQDPGYILISACIEHQIPFTTIGGSCSLIQALLLSGLSTERFQFIGFLPKNPKTLCKEILAYPGTSILFESPHRILKTLKLFEELDPERNIAIVREMTKTFEETLRGSVSEVVKKIESHPLKGEIVLVIEKGRLKDDMPIEELVQILQNVHGLSLKEAIQKAAELKEIPKKIVYQKIHKISKN